MMNVIHTDTVTKWGIFEVTLKGPSEGNPFTEHEIKAVFCGENETITCDGFYDGDGRYCVRFMPSFEGTYHFEITSSFAKKQTGSFTVVPAEEGNHGPVRTVNTWHFAYEDGTTYYSIGTTCYVWTLQTDELIEKTLETLKNSAFNKIRFCVFPKHYNYNLGEPRSYPYEGTPMDSSVLNKDNFWNYTDRSEGNSWDFTKFNPSYFRHLESCILRLMEMGIEADLIMMHPYDRWGFSCMKSHEDDLYWKYVIARLSAFRNIWWSLANEYDLMPQKTTADWERYAQILCEKDSYRHLRSIHNCVSLYDYNRPWITHVSIQRTDLYKSSEMVNEWRTLYKKPVVMDEIAYEGNIQYGWGNITGQEMVRRFWEAACRGGYPGHGETFIHKDDVLWWSHGGSLHGESHKRFQFLLDILKETPGIGLMPYEKCAWDEVCAVPQEISSLPEKTKEYYLYYYSFMQPSFREFYFDDDTMWQVRVIDTWNMTIEDKGQYQGRFSVELPGRQFMAIQIRRCLAENRGDEAVLTSYDLNAYSSSNK